MCGQAQVEVYTRNYEEILRSNLVVESRFEKRAVCCVVSTKHLYAQDTSRFLKRVFFCGSFQSGGTMMSTQYAVLFDMCGTGGTHEAAATVRSADGEDLFVQHLCESLGCMDVPTISHTVAIACTVKCGERCISRFMMRVRTRDSAAEIAYRATIRAGMLCSSRSHIESSDSKTPTGWGAGWSQPMFPRRSM